jgi:putative SOS response-associated peptidase YedK
MCGQYAIVSKIEEIEKKFNVRLREGEPPVTNRIVVPGSKDLVITNEHPRELQGFIFGFTPSWADKPKYIINARVEGSHNKENSPDYKGGKGIISKPFFRKAIRSQRCLVIADSFIESTGKKEQKRSFNVYLKEHPGPFAFAGIWDRWLNEETGELLDTFAIITTRPNQLMLKLPYNRMPVILDPSMYIPYLDKNTPLSDITNILEPYPAQQMNAYEIGSSFYKEREDAHKALQPVSQRIEKETDLNLQQELKLFGMGETPSREKKKKRK